MKALVSIVIPTYNRKNKVSAAIDSCLKQTYDSIEVVICDDHSSDGTIEYLKAKYAGVNNIIYCTTPMGKKGANAARNEGIRRSHGRFVAFLDSDDYLLEDSVAVRMAVLESTGCGMVYGDIYTQGRKGGICSLAHFDDISTFNQRKYLMRELSLCSMIGILVRKEILEKIHYMDESLKSWQDDDLVISVGMRYKIRHCMKPVAVAVASPNSISTCKDSVYQGCKRIVEKHKNEIITYTSYMRYLLWKIRILLLKAKYKENQEKNWIKKMIYKYTYISLKMLIKPFFRHMYA